MKLKQCAAGALAAALLVGYAAAPQVMPFGETVVAEAQAASSKLAKPENVKASVTDPAKIRVSWSEVKGADGYAVYMATSKNGKYKKLKTVSAGSKLRVTASKLTVGKKYYFKVRAYQKKDGETVWGEYSDTVKKTASAYKDSQISILKKNVPIYADYLLECEKFPVTLEAEIYEGGEFVLTMRGSYTSLDNVASYMSDGTDEIWAIMKDSAYYLVSASEKIALYMPIGEETEMELLDEMTASMTPDFDIENAKYKTGKKKYNGKNYLYEKITDKEMVIEIYADTKTKEIRYMVIGTSVLKMNELSHKEDKSLFEIPKDYEILDMTEVMNQNA